MNKKYLLMLVPAALVLILIITYSPAIRNQSVALVMFVLNLLLSVVHVFFGLSMLAVVVLFPVFACFVFAALGNKVGLNRQSIVVRILTYLTWLALVSVCHMLITYLVINIPTLRAMFDLMTMRQWVQEQPIFGWGIYALVTFMLVTPLTVTKSRRKLD